MKPSPFILIIALLTTACSRYSVTSPDGNIKVTVEVKNATPQYSVTKDGSDIILPSRLGFDNHTYTLVYPQKTKHDNTWKTTWGEETYIRNNYQELSLSLRDENRHTMLVRFRVFDDGIAFRYEFAKDSGDFIICDEQTEYRFADDPNLWSIPWNTPYYEGLWTKNLLSSQADTLCSPVTIEFSDGSYGFLHEAALDDYPAQNFYRLAACGSQSATTLATYLTPWSTGVSVYAEYGKTVSPWRMLVLADNITELAASRIMLNLNEPCKITDTSWIKPMKFIGIWWAIHLDKYSWCYRMLDENGKFLKLAPYHGATTSNMKRYIDFAAEHNFGGVLAEGWNEGWDGDWTSNLASFTQPTPDFDISAISEYAAQKGVQVIGHHETGGNITNYENQLDAALDFYERYGIHNVKTGYVHAKLEGKEWHKSQYGVRHMNMVIRKAAEKHVCIDNHECVMPTGLCRTYPNLMTGEGVRGQEWDAWSTDGGSPAEHLCILPFTRCMAGPVDFTPGTFDFSNPVHPQTRVHSTLARQLALFVTVYSPLQMASDMPESYMQHPKALKFIEDVPCNWNKSVVPDAVIGDYVVTARQDRDSQDWYLGAITDENQREISLPLDFLDENIVYTAEIYRDNENTDWQQRPYEITIEEKTVSSADTLLLSLSPAGGTAIRFSKQ